ncbi:MULTISPECIES: XRE family transcriptional regulator [Mesorhizobium]|uniref:XRE family transcriptional regulator n=1 Tax=Mesorhizobium abyssinicae TaxID=1209958 RepID=A0ABU5AVY2_9HYPH|nr:MULTISPECIES: XRE family transcriptional regulator [Mesorhizobium]MDX8541465.1 XRE family transcriptional regulator [Mesorhizobium abyssinicae]RWB66604.1 MAG: XRE family transcriptional regulator [Mesorhizobium sp.]RWB83313.1 MAG: XRE family transcriptional regulator [Mesorhizobium sp.]
MRKPQGPTSSRSEISEFVDERINQLVERKSPEDIAEETGFANVSLLLKIREGVIKVPLDRVPGLARALECDPRTLFLLALGQYLDQEALVTIKQIIGPSMSQNEVAWVEALRRASDNADPPLSTKREKIIRAMFGKIRRQPG